jgi:hypothetical protein
MGSRLIMNKIIKINGQNYRELQNEEQILPNDITNINNDEKVIKSFPWIIEQKLKAGDFYVIKFYRKIINDRRESEIANWVPA